MTGILSEKHCFVKESIIYDRKCVIFFEGGDVFYKFCPFRVHGLNIKKSKYQGSLSVKVRERKRDYEVPLKLTRAARRIISKQLQRAAS